MKAIVRKKYGTPDILELQEIEKPVPKANEILVKIHATSINKSDWELLTGKPLFTRIYGLIKPRVKILGSDIAGRVEAVGKKVAKFKIGDEVFGDIFDTFGGFAEYVSVPEKKLMLKPADITFEQAAAIPQAAVIAWQGLCDKGKIQPGQEVLVNGAGGGAGSFAVQLAKSKGAIVTAVDNTEKLEMMSSIGADYVIDYTKEDFTKNGKSYDIILDLAAHHSIFDYKRSLAPKGIYSIVGGSMKQIFQLLFLGPIISIFSKKKMSLLALKINKNLDIIIGLIQSKKMKPIIDKQYPLKEVPDALQYIGEGHVKGKVVIVMKQKNKA